MNSFDSDIIEMQFRTDSEGRIIFFADGLSKPGYVVPNMKIKNEIQKIYSNYFKSLLLLFFIPCYGSLSVQTVLITVFLYAFFSYIFYTKKKKAILGLEISDLIADNGSYLIPKSVLFVCFLMMLVAMSGFIMPIILQTFGLKGLICSISGLLFIMIISIMILYRSEKLKEIKKKNSDHDS